MPAARTMSVEGIASYVAGTAVYPLDGKGGYTLDPALSFARSAGSTFVRFAFSGRESSSSYIELYHGDGSRAMYFRTDVSTEPSWSLTLADGLLLTGNWYAKFGDTTPEWTIGFEAG